MAMRWTSYLVLHLPEVAAMPDWMQRSHRADVIMRGYIYPPRSKTSSLPMARPMTTMHSIA